MFVVCLGNTIKIFSLIKEVNKMLRLLIVLTITGLSLCFVLNSNVSAEQVLTWDDCVREAIENHPNLISASEKLKQS